jgi:hypothetical protein
MNFDHDILAAAQRWIRLRDRDEHPIGDFDRAGRFHLDERFPCCAGIRSPSRRYPYSEMLHGRSLAHVLQEAGLQEREREVRAALRLIDPERAARRKLREEKCDALRRSLVQRFVTLAGECETLVVAASTLAELIDKVRAPHLLKQMMAYSLDELVAYIDRRSRQPMLAIALRLWRSGEGERQQFLQAA